ncbi:universal stress protein [Pedobacter paludis]|uniref:Universal stress protein n=1 Tax=Pedobacter paludis TaxID=2203212 RepID=A0A317EWX1_9SPHI|nr:universal stress protein [Pedobacter paludis]PWS30463.1 universal stress protein [Pedobacter paludis]
MKRIATVFDGLDFAGSTMDFAIGYCKKSDAHLVGVFPESFLYHEYDFAELLGKNGISAVKIRHAVMKEAKKRARSRKLFADGCKKAKISYSISHPEGITIDEVLKESTFADMILIAKGERFSTIGTQLPSTFTRQLLSDSRCPVLLLDERIENHSRVLLLYDGKPGSVYAIKLFFSLFAAEQDTSTEVLYVTSSDPKAEIPDFEKIKALVECHRPGAIYTCISGPEKQSAIDYAQGLGPGTLTVAGAYGRGSTSRWFIPSIADGLIAQCRCSLLVAHNR